VLGLPVAEDRGGGLDLLDPLDAEMVSCTAPLGTAVRGGQRNTVVR
jgi:hypothetical protein